SPTVWMPSFIKSFSVFSPIPFSSWTGVSLFIRHSPALISRQRNNRQTHACYLSLSYSLSVSFVAANSILTILLYSQHIVVDRLAAVVGIHVHIRILLLYLRHKPLGVLLLDLLAVVQADELG